MRTTQIIICITLIIFIVLMYSCIKEDPTATVEPATESESEEEPSEDWNIDAETLEVSTPTTEETVPITEETVPITEETVPITEETVPITEETVPITEETSQECVMYFTENDVIMVAKTIYGEAGSSWIPREDKAKVAWTICNRVDNSRWPNSIAAVITQPNQFHGYSANKPVTDECYEIAKDVLTRWSLEKNGVEVYREASKNITGFYGDGYANHFYES